MSKEEVLSQIEQSGLMAVIRANSEEQAFEIAHACVKGGIKILELTFTIPSAHKVIESLSQHYANTDILIGAGTVLDAHTARLALLSGARFVVSPNFDSETVSLSNLYRTAVIPGVMTVSEAVLAMSAGADVLKVFPADLFGPKIISALKGPLPQAKMIPTGGVNLENIYSWFDAGAVAVGVCGSLLAGADVGDYDKISKTAESFVRAVEIYRQGKI